MKKTYMQPAMLVVKIKTPNMLNTSPDGYNRNLNNTGKDGSKALSKGRRGIFEEEVIEEDQSIW